MHRTPDKTALEIMRNAAELGYALRKQRFVTTEIIHHEMTTPSRKEILRMALGHPVSSRTAHLVIKHHNWRSGFQHITSICPKISSMGLALARIQLRDRGFVGMQYVAFEQ